MEEKPEDNAKTHIAYCAWTNTDLSEGRGKKVPFAISQLRTTAQRLGRGKGVGGRDCVVEEVEIYDIDGKLFGPIYIHFPTVEDSKLEEKLENHDSSMLELTKLGLDETQIKRIVSKINTQLI